MISWLNEKSLPPKFREKCDLYHFERVIESKIRKSNETESSHAEIYLIIRVRPGNAVFEAMVRYDDPTDSKNGVIVNGNVNRISRYGSETECIDESEYKDYCHCKNN